jgi:hypothetical protein
MYHSSLLLLKRAVKVICTIWSNLPGAPEYSPSSQTFQTGRDGWGQVRVCPSLVISSNSSNATQRSRPRAPSHSPVPTPSSAQRKLCRWWVGLTVSWCDFFILLYTEDSFEFVKMMHRKTGKGKSSLGNWERKRVIGGVSASSSLCVVLTLVPNYAV